MLEHTEYTCAWNKFHGKLDWCVFGLIFVDFLEAYVKWSVLKSAGNVSAFNSAFRQFIGNPLGC